MNLAPINNGSWLSWGRGLLLSAAVCLSLVAITQPAAAQVNYFWNDANGGAFNDANNWTSPFPGTSPGLASRAIFDLANAYTVTYPNNLASGTVASVRRGNMIFDMQGNTFNLGNIAVAEFADNIAELTIVDGTYNPTTTVIGEANPSSGTVIVGEGGRFDPNSFRVGNNGTGTLQIQDGGRVTAAATRLGDELTGNGTIRVMGTDGVGNRSTFTDSRHIIVGVQGHGEMHITGGGLVQTNPNTALEQRDTIALFPAPGSGLGATGDVTIDGVAADGTPSTWTSTGQLSMGNIAGTAFAQGTMTITNGGQATHTEAVILGATEAQSRVEIRGTDTADNPSKWTLSSGGLDISGGGEVLIAEGGAFESPGGIVIGQIYGLESSVTVTGASANGVRSSYTGGGLTVGSDGDSELTVTDGAMVTAPGLLGSLQVGNNTTSDGSVLISGKDASDNPATVTMGRTVILGNQGAASLTVSDGGMLTTGFDDPLSFGFVALRDTSSATVEITGQGSKWSHARNLFVGGGAAGAGGTAEMTIADGAMVDIGLTLKVWNTSNVFLAGGTLIADEIDITDGGGFDFSEGVLSVNTFSGDLVNEDGILAPGEPLGQTVISGAYQQLGGATMAIEVGGLTQETEHDQIVAGTAALDGTLDVTLIDEFVPDHSDTFVVLASETITGEFSQYTGDVFTIEADLALVPVIEIDVPVNDGADVVRLVTTAPGDTNLDFMVDAADLNTLALNWMGSDKDWFEADFNNDGTVNAADLNLLAINWQFGVDEPALASFEQEWVQALSSLHTAVPEPGTAAVLMALSSWVTLRRRPTG